LRGRRAWSCVDTSTRAADSGATIAAPAQARKWWTDEIARIANARQAEPAELVSPLHVSELIALVETGELTDRLARQVLEGVIEGEGRPSGVVEKRGLKVVSDGPSPNCPAGRRSRSD
jgi:aspartyl-tRNA(Asn)/glutamyl-tRNA(Gln) amidotransferase subunit B